MSTNSTSIRASTCKGMNCASTAGTSHSAECEAEHAAACAGGDFVPWSKELKRSGTAGYGLWFSKEQRDESMKNELRRLHAANVDLLEALKAAWKVIGPMSPTNDWVAAGCVIHEAIEKHGGTS